MFFGVTVHVRSNLSILPILKKVGGIRWVSRLLLSINKMKKYILSIVSVITIIVLVFVSISGKEAPHVSASGVAGPSFLQASSTAFTLTTTSQRLLGTTTPQGQSGARVSATIQPLACPAVTSGVFLRMQSDVVATANTGLLAFASTTLILGDHVNDVPNVRGAVQGITNTGTCTVLVTEWRTQ